MEQANHSSDKLNGWNTQSSGPTGINTSTNICDNDDKRYYVQGHNMKRTMNMEINHDGRNVEASVSVLLSGRRSSSGP